MKAGSPIFLLLKHWWSLPFLHRNRLVSSRTEFRVHKHMLKPIGLNLGWGSEAWSTHLSLSTGSDAVLSKDCRMFEVTPNPSALESFSSAAASWLNEAQGSCAAHKGMSGCRGADAQVSPRNFWKCTKLFWAIWKWWEHCFPFWYGKREKTQSCIDQIRVPKIMCFQQVAYRKGWTCGVSRGCNIFISTLNVTDGPKSESKVLILLFFESTWNLNPSMCFGQHWSHINFRSQVRKK